MTRPLHFVWGPGGVGKTHFSIYFAFQKAPECSLLTLDPSPRLIQLLGLAASVQDQEASLLRRSWMVRQTSADRIFEKMNKIAPASESVKIYFDELFKGLHRFRDYLSLLDISDEILKKTDKALIIDTPPFLEAQGLAQAIQDLNQFFDSPLVSKGLRSHFLQSGFQKILHLAQGFLGKLGVEQALAFLDWISMNLESLQNSTRTLKNVFTKKESFHSLVFSPESSNHQIQSTAKFFSSCQNLQVIMNRSLEHLPFFSEEYQPLFRELQNRLAAERRNEALLKNLFPQAQYHRFPLQLMGEDSKEEMEVFLQTSFFT